MAARAPREGVVVATSELIQNGSAVTLTFGAVSEAAATRLFDAIRSDLDDGLVAFGEIAIGPITHAEEGFTS